MSEELRDFYYSEYSAAFNNGLCHTVNGQEFTESVKHGETPITSDIRIVLIASGVPQSDVVYNPELLKQNRSRKSEIRIEPKGSLMQPSTEGQSNKINYYRSYPINE